jgi:hypothetical protein
MTSVHSPCETETPRTDTQEFPGYMLHLTATKWHLPEHTNILINTTATCKI